MAELIKRTIDTSIGKLVLYGDGETVEVIMFGTARPSTLRPSDSVSENPRAYAQATAELKEYLDGRRTKFTFPLLLRANGFKRAALNALRRVPFGKTVSYRELAELAGSSRAFRAAGSACATNPLPIVIPCHRVLKADGSLGGFGGGLKIKKMLLDLEQAQYKES